VSRNPEFLNIEKYNNNVLLKYDHMTHYIFCILYGFRNNIISWRDNDSKHKLVDRNYYLSQEKMSDYEIKQYLSNTKIDIKRNNIIDGYHRCFCMIGRILRGEKYIPFTCSDKAAPFILTNNFLFKLCSFKISNVGYRPKHNKRRLKLIEKNIDTSNFTLVDIGSNFGYFSLNLAMKYPASMVYSIEGSFGTGNDNVYNKNKIITTKGIKCHQRLKEKNFIFNNYIVCALMTQGVLKSLHKYNIVFDYQLSLSVFHWIVFEKLGNFGRPDSIYDLFF